MSANQENTCIVIGAGGHARVVLDILLNRRPEMKLILLDADQSLWGSKVMGVDILGGDNLLPELFQRGASKAIVALGATRGGGLRKRLFDTYSAIGFTPVEVIHSTAVCSKWAELGHGVQVLASAVINAGARVGRNTIVNTGAIIEHDCRVEDHVHVATAARLCGGVRIGEMAHIGAGAVLREGVKVGPRAVVGAGAVVVRDVTESTVVAGCPAVPLTAKCGVRHA